MIRFALLALVLVAGPAIAQTKKAPAPSKTGPTKSGSTRTAPAAQKTTLSGVYTLEEAEAGKELYAALCGTCHTTSNRHDDAVFRKKWTGKTLSDLFVYMRTTMPKNDPGSLADEDYAIILAHMLRLNKLPPGKAYLSTDTLDLRKIRFDSVRAVRKP